MPTWTNPAAHIFATGEVVTATTLNTYVQQNLTFLGSSYYMRAYQSGSAQSFSASTWTRVTLNATDYDPAGTFNTGTSTFTAPVAGRYIVTAAMAFAVMTGPIYVALYQNGTIKVMGQSYTNATFGGATVSSVMKLNASDTVQFYAQQAGSGAISANLVNGTGVNVYMSASLLGPL